MSIQRGTASGNAHKSIAYIFDSVHEGCGTTEAVFEDWASCVAKALELAKGCDCNDMGCPRCLTTHGCPQSNEALSKFLGVWLLEQIVEKRSVFNDSNCQHPDSQI